MDILFLSDGPVTIPDGSSTWGGTEATLQLVSRWLASHGLQVGIISPIKQPRLDEAVHFLEIKHWLDKCPIKIYLRRMYISPLQVRSAERSYIWLHDLVVNPIQHDIPVIAVSHFLLNKLHQESREHPLDTVIWNPVSPQVRSFRQPAPREDYMVWTSAIVKNTLEALQLYTRLYQRGLRRPLRICAPLWNSPASFPWPNLLSQYPIEYLGSLEQSKTFELLSKAACLYRPSPFPETFGLIYAEASTLGVPTLTVDNGAAGEVLMQPGNLLLGEKHTITDILRWLENIHTQQIGSYPGYELDQVGKQWINLIQHHYSRPPHYALRSA